VAERLGGLARLEQMPARARDQMTAEHRIRYPMGHEWFLGAGRTRPTSRVRQSATVCSRFQTTPVADWWLQRVAIPLIRVVGPAGLDHAEGSS
jgi:hypothetical protein